MRECQGGVGQVWHSVQSPGKSDTKVPMYKLQRSYLLIAKSHHNRPLRHKVHMWKWYLINQNCCSKVHAARKTSDRWATEERGQFVGWRTQAYGRLNCVNRWCPYKGHTPFPTSQQEEQLPDTEVTTCTSLPCMHCTLPSTQFKTP